jgi:hypothetical protein
LTTMTLTTMTLTTMTLTTMTLTTMTLTTMTLTTMTLTTMTLTRTTMTWLTSDPGRAGGWRPPRTGPAWARRSGAGPARFGQLDARHARPLGRHRRQL